MLQIQPTVITKFMEGTNYDAFGVMQQFHSCMLLVNTCAWKYHDLKIDSKIQFHG